MHQGIATNYNRELHSAAREDDVFWLCSLASIAKKNCPRVWTIQHKEYLSSIAFLDDCKKHSQSRLGTCFANYQGTTIEYSYTIPISLEKATFALFLHRQICSYKLWNLELLNGSVHWTTTEVELTQHQGWTQAPGAAHRRSSAQDSSLWGGEPHCPHTGRTWLPRAVGSLHCRMKTCILAQ